MLDSDDAESLELQTPVTPPSSRWNSDSYRSVTSEKLLRKIDEADVFEKAVVGRCRRCTAEEMEASKDQL